MIHDYWRNWLNDYTFTNPTQTGPEEIKLGFGTYPAEQSDTTLEGEPTGVGGYERQIVHFDQSSKGYAYNVNDIEFAKPTANWGDLRSWGLFAGDTAPQPGAEPVRADFALNADGTPRTSDEQTAAFNTAHNAWEAKSTGAETGGQLLYSGVFCQFTVNEGDRPIRIPAGKLRVGLGYVVGGTD